jgi:lysozyme family protein
MSYIYQALEPEYEKLLGSCYILPSRKAVFAKRAAAILPLKPRYTSVSEKTGVPVLWLMVINERESGSNMHTYLGNGQSLGRRTTLVPKGRGPFDDWEDGALDALHLDRIDQVKDWCWPRALYEEELWNGFGPRMHGRHSGYLWAGTNAYNGGKYVSDGVWDADARDSQLGCAGLMLTLTGLDKTLDLPQSPNAAPATGGTAAAVPVPQQHPDLTVHGILWVQASLNELDNAKLATDGSYGRETARAVTAFQEAHDLDVDGIPGPLTKAALEAALADARKEKTDA